MRFLTYAEILKMRDKLTTIEYNGGDFRKYLDTSRCEFSYRNLTYVLDKWINFYILHIPSPKTKYDPESSVIVRLNLRPSNKKEYILDPKNEVKENELRKEYKDDLLNTTYFDIDIYIDYCTNAIDYSCGKFKPIRFDDAFNRYLSIYADSINKSFDKNEYTFNRLQELQNQEYKVTWYTNVPIDLINDFLDYILQKTKTIGNHKNMYSNKSTSNIITLISKMFK